MSHKKNNRIFVILIIIICVISILGVIYNIYTHDKNTSNDSNHHLEKKATMEVQSLIDLQRDKGPNAILEIDCLKETSTDSKKYCLESQEILKSIYNK